jgi:hypothetical protein
MNLLYAKLPLEFKDHKTALEHYKNVDHNLWVKDTYRNVSMLPLYTPNGVIDPRTVIQNSRDAELKWTKYADTSTINFFEENIFPWLDKKGRIMLLKTPPGDSMLPHIDCSKQEFNTKQHKIRLVLQGNVDSLNFITKNGDLSPKSDHRNVYIIDGSWPHYITNTFDDHKYTICLGSPWSGGSTEKYLNLLSSSDDLIEIDKNELPKNYEEYFEDPIHKQKLLKT